MGRGGANQRGFLPAEAPHHRTLGEMERRDPSRPPVPGSKSSSPKFTEIQGQKYPSLTGSIQKWPTDHKAIYLGLLTVPAVLNFYLRPRTGISYPVTV